MAKGAVLYIRVSTPEQASGNYSLPTQEAKERNFCRQQGLTVLKLFADEESARTDDRPEFKKMLAYCRQHRREISHVIVSDLSRLARNVLDQGQTLVELAQLGIELVSVDEPNLDESAAGKLLKNVLGSMNQFFSDSLSEKTKFRMAAGARAGRWLFKSPIGYRNDTRTKTVVVDGDAAAFVRKAFSLIADGSYASTDSVLRLLVSMGFQTSKGQAVSRQTFSKMLRNPFYSGWVVSGATRVRGNHEPLISQELFDKVQEKLAGNTNGKVAHKKVNEDFPLRGYVKCAGCGKNLTAAWSRGKGGQRFPYYFCWNRDCKSKIYASREQIEFKYFSLLSAHSADAAVLAQLPVLAARMWSTRQETIANDARLLTRRLDEQTTLNTRLITAKLKGELSQKDFELMKFSIEAETQKIENEIKALDSEKSKMEELIKQREQEPVNFGNAWRDAPFHQKIEMQKVFYPDGLVYHPKTHFFEPRNTYYFHQLAQCFSDMLELGVPDGI